MTTRSRRKPPKSILIGDAGVLVGFILGGQIGILTLVCQGKDFVLQVPNQVDVEVVRVIKRKDVAVSPTGVVAWKMMKDMGLVVVLKEPTIGSPVAASVAAYLGVRSGSKPTSEKDLGEYYVISHAVDLQARGESVAVAIDDATARLLARAKKLEVLTTEQLLEYAIEFDAFPNGQELVDCYDKIGEVATLRPLTETMLELHQQNREKARSGTPEP